MRDLDLPIYNLSSTEYIRNTEQILTGLVQSEQRIVSGSLHGKPVYIVTDMALAKQIFEDGKNFSFTPNDLSNNDALTDGAKAFVSEGLESPLLASTYDEYKESRKLFNQVFKRSYTDRLTSFDERAKAHLATLLNDLKSPHIDAIALCQQFAVPLVADIIGIASLSYPELLTIADCSRIMVEGNGLQGNCDAVAQVSIAHNTILDLVRKVADAKAAPDNSALGYLLQVMDREAAIGFARTFILGGIDTGSSSLVFATYLLANNSDQRAQFIALDEHDQQEAISELISKEAPAYYSPRFAVRDIVIDGVEIAAGSFVQLATYALNKCANPDFNINRGSKRACPIHDQETLPFGHARHKCPGEDLARHLSAIFLNGLFKRYPVINVEKAEKELNTFSRRFSSLTLHAMQQ
jgi:cytochrome P450